MCALISIWNYTLNWAAYDDMGETIGKFFTGKEIGQLCDKTYKWFQRRKDIVATCHKALDLLQVDSNVVPHSNVLPHSSRLVASQTKRSFREFVAVHPPPTTLAPRPTLLTTSNPHGFWPWNVSKLRLISVGHKATIIAPNNPLVTIH